MHPRGGVVLSIIDVHAGSTVSRKRRKRRSRKPARQPAAPVKPAAKGWRRETFAWGVVWACLLAAIVWLGWRYHNQVNAHQTPSDVPTPGKGAMASYAPKVFTRKARDLDALLNLPPYQLADVDIAEMNLLCAAGLPGAKGLDIDHCLATLDR